MLEFFQYMTSGFWVFVGCWTLMALGGMTLVRLAQVIFKG